MMMMMMMMMIMMMMMMIMVITIIMPCRHMPLLICSNSTSVASPGYREPALHQHAYDVIYRDAPCEWAFGLRFELLPSLP